MTDIVALRRRVQSPDRYAVRVVESPTTDVAGPTDVTGLIHRTGLAGLVRPATGTDPSSIGRVLPVLAGLRPLLPGGGLRRGSTIGISTGGGGGATSLLLAALAGASAAGSWCGIVGAPWLGAVAAAEMGIELGRLALVPHPGPDWTAVVAALLDGLDVVVVVPPGPVAASVTSRLAARARQRDSVLMPFGPWAGADVVLSASGGAWLGLGAGHGRLRGRGLTVSARGRGAAAHPRQARMWLPGIDVAATTLAESTLAESTLAESTRTAGGLRVVGL